VIVKTCTRLLLLLALLTVSLATTVARAQGGAEWEPDPASAEALLGPRRSFGEFSVRIPNAFVFAGPRWATNASETSYSWTAGLQAGNEQTPFTG